MQSKLTIRFARENDWDEIEQITSQNFSFQSAKRQELNGWIRGHGEDFKCRLVDCIARYSRLLGFAVEQFVEVGIEINFVDDDEIALIV